MPLAAQAQMAIGQWRDHFPNNDAIAVTEGGGRAWCATARTIFSHEPATGEVERFSKARGLNDVDISAIHWNQTHGVLLVGYSNGNLDLLRPSGTVNMADILRSNVIGEKRILSIRSEGDLAYLSCGFGIVVVDIGRREVRDTWYIGPEGGQLRVFATEVFGDSIYAATASGLFVASRNAVNLAAFTSWRRRPDIPMPNGPFDHVLRVGGQLLVNYTGTNGPDSVFVLQQGAWQRFEPLFGERNVALTATTDGAWLSVTHPTYFRVYDAELGLVAIYYDINGEGYQTEQAALAGGGWMWVADKRLGLVRTTGPNNGVVLTPNGPRNASAYRINAVGGAVAVATGSVAGNWANAFRHDGLHRFVEGSWRTLDRSNTPSMWGVNDWGASVVDLMAVAVDPRDPSHWFAGSWEEGLLEFRGNDLVQIHNTQNSSLQQHIGLTQEKTDIGGLCFDLDGNLWMSNSSTNGAVVVRTPSGSWRSFNTANVLGNNTLVSDIVAASNGFKWVVRPRGNGILVYDDNGTISDPNDDRVRTLNSFEGTGGLPTNDVFAIAEDLNGEVWVGTGRGIAVFYNPDAIFTPGANFDAQQILIEQDGNIQILLETEIVTSIAVDGANRKWIGTQSSGAFLVSRDGREQIRRFARDNSPLPSNNITSIAVEPVTGEVYFGTDQGIVSFRGDATEGGFEATCAKVFPNPVKEHHTGPVAITGLVRDSDVRITDMSGNLVYRTTSLGGQAIWPATDMSGNRVSTGVYLVFATDREGTYKCNTKVLVVR